LTHKIEPLLKITNESFDQLFEEFSESNYKNGELSAMYFIEKGLMNYFYHGNIQATKDFESAKLKTNLKLELTGKLGVRTKFQKHKVAQLSLIATSKEEEEEEEKVEELQENKSEVLLDEDSILLENPKLEDTEDEKKLRIVDQCIILALWFDLLF
jgi:hypothetical protein